MDTYNMPSLAYPIMILITWSWRNVMEGNQASYTRLCLLCFQIYGHFYISWDQLQPQPPYTIPRDWEATIGTKITRLSVPITNCELPIVSLCVIWGMRIMCLLPGMKFINTQSSILVFCMTSVITEKQQAVAMLKQSAVPVQYVQHLLVKVWLVVAHAWVKHRYVTS